ncbi:MAG: hypothetical protein QMD66_07365 [Actinomycetota bacterium]|nr:hypothetical protein [Actinomycetota bacterium]
MEELKLKEKRVRVVFQKEIEPTELNAIPAVTKVEREERGYLLTVDGDVTSSSPNSRNSPSSPWR